VTIVTFTFITIVTFSFIRQFKKSLVSLLINLVHPIKVIYIFQMNE